MLFPCYPVTYRHPPLLIWTSLPYITDTATCAATICKGEAGGNGGKNIKSVTRIVRAAGEAKLVALKSQRGHVLKPGTPEHAGTPEHPGTPEKPGTPELPETPEHQKPPEHRI